MNETLAEEIIGGRLSEPSKMPCYSFSIPAKRCKTGQKLRKIKGTICSICYALKGNYVRFPNIQESQEKKYKKLKHKKWVEAITYLINRFEQSGFFRWFDAGDLQGVWHLKNIAAVARNLPHIKFWLPTREYKIVSDYLKEEQCPENLIIRLSAYMIDGPPPTQLAKKLGVLTSGVTKEGFTCPAYSNGNFCGSCRSCWSKEVENVSYKKH